MLRVFGTYIRCAGSANREERRIRTTIFREIAHTTHAIEMSDVSSRNHPIARLSWLTSTANYTSRSSGQITAYPPAPPLSQLRNPPVTRSGFTADAVSKRRRLHECSPAIARVSPVSQMKMHVLRRRLALVARFFSILSTEIILQRIANGPAFPDQMRLHLSPKQTSTA